MWHTIQVWFNCISASLSFFMFVIWTKKSFPNLVVKLIFGLLALFGLLVTLESLGYVISK